MGITDWMDESESIWVGDDMEVHAYASHGRKRQTEQLNWTGTETIYESFIFMIQFLFDPAPHPTYA